MNMNVERTTKTQNWNMNMNVERTTKTQNWNMNMNVERTTKTQNWNMNMNVDYKNTELKHARSAQNSEQDKTVCFAQTSNYCAHYI